PSPSGSAIYWVEDLNFDRALVLLNLFTSARIYTDQVFATDSRALAIREVQCITDASVLVALVGDLAHDRVVVISASHAAQLRELQALRCPVFFRGVDFAVDGGCIMLLLAI